MFGSAPAKGGRRGTARIASVCFLQERNACVWAGLSWEVEVQPPKHAIRHRLTGLGVAKTETGEGCGAGNAAPGAWIRREATARSRCFPREEMLSAGRTGTLRFARSRPTGPSPEDSLEDGCSVPRCEVANASCLAAIRMGTSDEFKPIDPLPPPGEAGHSLLSTGCGRGGTNAPFTSRVLLLRASVRLRGAGRGRTGRCWRSCRRGRSGTATGSATLASLPRRPGRRSCS
jgi:hypothetical protein